MTQEQRRYVVKEALISAVINALISAAFAYAVFRGQRAELWGSPSLALDFVPQTFAIAAFSVLVPTLLARKRVRAGAVQQLVPMRAALPPNVLLRALLVALVVTVVLAWLAISMAAALVQGPQPFLPVLALKVGYGALVALIVTPFALRHALADEPRTRR